MNIIKIVATRCQILRLKCTKFNFGWGSALDFAREQPSPDFLAGFKGPTSKGRGGERWKWKERRDPLYFFSADLRHGSDIEGYYQRVMWFTIKIRT